jgi:hypothetical protein
MSAYNKCHYQFRVECLGPYGATNSCHQAEKQASNEHNRSTQKPCMLNLLIHLPPSLTHQCPCPMLISQPSPQPTKHSVHMLQAVNCRTMHRVVRKPCNAKINNEHNTLKGIATIARFHSRLDMPHVCGGSLSCAQTEHSATSSLHSHLYIIRDTATSLQMCCQTAAQSSNAFI